MTSDVTIRPTAVEIAQLIDACQGVNEVHSIARRMAFQLDSLTTIREALVQYGQTLIQLNGSDECDGDWEAHETTRNAIDDLARRLAEEDRDH